MNLRQIIRNQKLSNFNYKLSDFISEQDKISSGEKTSTGIPKFWYKNKDGKTVSSTDQNAQDRGYEIATKEELPKEKQPKKVDTKGDEEEIKVDISDEEKEKINDFGEEIGLHPSDTDPDVFVDDNGNAVMTIGSDGTLLAVDEPGELSDKEAKDFEKRINDFNTGTDDVTTDVVTFMSDEEGDDEDEADEAEEELDNFPPPTYTKTAPTAEEIDKAEAAHETLLEDGFFSGPGALSDEDSETSDGLTKQVGLLLGYPAGGSAKPYILGNEKDLSKEQKEAGVQALGLRPGETETREWRAAPGNAGSQLNEILSCEGANILEQNPDLSAEELAILMYKQFSETQCAQQNSGNKPAAGFGKKVVPEGYDVGIYTKMLASAYAAKAKAELTDLALDVNSDENGFDRDSAKISQFYGAQQSIDDQVAMAENATGRIFSPGGDEITDKDELIELIKAGGGGDNPSDTATFIEDKHGNLIVAFHSDKMSTGDIQANSTISQEITEMKSVIENDDDIPDEEKNKIYKRLEKMRDEVKKAEAGLPKVLVEPAGVLSDHIEGDKKLQKEMLKRMAGEKDIKNKMTPLMKKFKKAATGAYVAPPGTREKIKNHLTTDNPTDEEVLVAFMKYAADESPPKLTDEQQKIIARTSKLYADEIDDDALKIDRRLDAIRKDTIRAEQNTRKDINKIGSVEVNGQDVPYGDYLEAKNIDKKLHLSAMNQGRDEPPEAHGIMKYADAFKLNMAGVIVGPEQLRDCMEVDNTDEFTGNFEVDDIDPDDDSSENLTFDTSVDPPQVTGRKAAVYAITKEGKRIPIAVKVLRSKSGQLGKLQSTYEWSGEMQKCFKGGDKKANESIKYFGDILDELKQNTLGYHWMKAEEDYPVHYFIREINKGSLN